MNYKMMRGLVVEESMSNLTCASGEVSASSGSRIEAGNNMYTQQSFASTNQVEALPPAKKRRNLPGNPDPNAQVIALSPKTLLATNRFICEICNKGFQRDQNLQLHRRGHNLPWKLKQRTCKEERKKVYVCPESTCVHHDPSRALGDLTGIKKHFSRKHCEKKWKCEKCSKKYAVKSDWKAHSKICGTREYRCDCGKVFSRRDSFITHRAFCDVLAEESVRGNPLLSSQQFGSSATHMLSLPSQLQISHGLQPLSSVKREQNQRQTFNPKPDINNIPPWLACPSNPGLTPLDFSSSPLFSGSSLNHKNSSPNPNSTSLNTPLQPPISSPHMSATALLQKAAQMGVTMSKPSPLPAAMLRPHQVAHMFENNTAAGFISSTEAESTAGSGLVLSSREELASGFANALSSFGNKATVTSGFMEQFAASTAGSGTGAAPSNFLHDMMTSLSPGNGFDGLSSFDDQALNYGVLNPKKFSNFQETLTRTTGSQFSINDHDSGACNKGGSDGLTRDFLGLKAFPQREFINITGLDYMNPPPPPSSSTYAEQNQNRRP
ncbi:hypothetical protein ACOSQ4_015692 [Xanthoceras sorbifolium]